MSQYEGITAGDFSRSTRKRLPICFCIDTSGSMEAPTTNGKTRMEEVNNAFFSFINAMKDNEDVAASADVAVVSFGGEAKIETNFQPIKDFNMEPFAAQHRAYTPLGESVQVALKMLEIRKEKYKEKGMKYYQPWLVVITDGEPEGENAAENMDIAIKQATDLEKESKLVIFNVGIGDDVNLDILKQLSVKREQPIAVSETNLASLFEFLGASSQSVINDESSTDSLYNNLPSADDVPQGAEISIDEWCI